SMHTAVTRFNTVVLLDRTNIGPSRKLLPKNRCLVNPANPLRKDCTAHSVLLDLQTNNIRPLTILTDTWCSSGQFPRRQPHPNRRRFRRFQENPKVHPLVEFFPPKKEIGAANFPFLSQKLFIFANNKAVLYDYNTNSVTKTYPILEGGPRNYPSAGSSAMLALTGDYSSATVVICGGAEYGAYLERMTDSPARGSCGRIEATRPDSVWEMEEYAVWRIMGDMVILPTGDVLIINGAQAGTQGFELASEPCLYPVLYRRTSRWTPIHDSKSWIGSKDVSFDREFVAGRESFDSWSNPHYFYKLNAEFSNELRIEAKYSAALVESPEENRIRGGVRGGDDVELPVVGIVRNFASAPFAHHSFSQGQRLVKLFVETPAVDGGGRVAPPGYYMVFAVNQGVPSAAKWVQLVA
ncbi:hypothetical protein Pfo_028934, partial [Paulownia fortunei]